MAIVAGAAVDVANAAIAGVNAAAANPEGMVFRTPPTQQQQQQQEEQQSLLLRKGVNGMDESNHDQSLLQQYRLCYRHHVPMSVFFPSLDDETEEDDNNEGANVHATAPSNRPPYSSTNVHIPLLFSHNPILTTTTVASQERQNQSNLGDHRRPRYFYSPPKRIKLLKPRKDPSDNDYEHSYNHDTVWSSFLLSSTSAASVPASASRAVSSSSSDPDSVAPPPLIFGGGPPAPSSWARAATATPSTRYSISRIRRAPGALTRTVAVRPNAITANNATNSTAKLSSLHQQQQGAAFSSTASAADNAAAAGMPGSTTLSILQASSKLSSDIMIPDWEDDNDEQLLLQEGRQGDGLQIGGNNRRRPPLLPRQERSPRNRMILDGSAFHITHTTNTAAANNRSPFQDDEK